MFIMFDKKCLRKNTTVYFIPMAEAFQFTSDKDTNLTLDLSELWDITHCYPHLGDKNKLITPEQKDRDFLRDLYCHAIDTQYLWLVVEELGGEHYATLYLYDADEEHQRKWELGTVPGAELSQLASVKSKILTIVNENNIFV